MAEPAQQPERPLERLLSAMADKGDLPAAARVIQRLHEAVRRDDCNSLDVARIILADPGLSSKVLRVVNSSFYRPRGEPVSTITRAVILLGFEAIRDLATGLVLLDEIARAGDGRAAIRAVLRESLLCASVARALSTTIHYPNPEEAYLLGLFANWGELSLAAYFPDEFAEATARARAEGTPIEEALTATFGVAPAALATAMLARWDFPASYANYFREPHPAGDRPVPSGQRLVAIVDLAHDYAVHAGTAGPGARVDPEAVRRYEAMFGRRGDELRVAIERGIEEAETTPIRAATPYLSVGRPAEPRPRPETAAAPAVRAVPAPEPAPAAVDVTTSAAPPAAFGILAEITRHILAQENINDTLAMVLEGIARTGPYDVAFLALLNVKKDRLIGRLGYGEGVADFLSALDIPVGQHDTGVLAECLHERSPRVVPEATAAMLMPAAKTAGIPAASFIAHPLVVRGRPVGVLVVARGEGRKRVDADDLTVVQLFCSQAALALDRAVH